MVNLPHPLRSILVVAFLLIAPACGTSTPTGVETTDVQGTWSGTFDSFALMGRTLSGDADWTFSKETFEIIFFNPPDDQAERIEGKWKFADGKIAIELTSSFPIDTDVGATDTLFVSILRDEMSLKTIDDSSILLFKTRLTKKFLLATYRGITSQYTLALPPPRAEQRSQTISKALQTRWETSRANIRFASDTKHPPA